jgi:hypothetical protein
MNLTTIQTQNQTKADPLPTSRILQRKCACGSHTTGEGQCNDCGEKEHSLQRKAISVNSSPTLAIQRKLAIGASDDPLEKEADRIADQVMSMTANAAITKAPLRIQRFTGSPTGAITEAPPSVERVLSNSGRPLEPGLRQDMEQRFGYDFSKVRVHTGAAAEQSTRNVDAAAYTAGHNIVFAAGRFVPDTRKGRRLIAHELVHVVQQNHQTQDSVHGQPTSGNLVQRFIQESTDTPPNRHPDHPLGYRESIELSECIAFWGEENAARCRRELLEVAPPPCIPQSCAPARQLTWDDFTGAPPHGGGAKAYTHFHLDLATDCDRQIIRAFFSPGNSWVRSQFANASDPILNGCAANRATCQQFFEDAAAVGRTGTQRLAPLQRTCAASIAPNPSVVASSWDDCNTLLGPECNRVAELESARLLAHEQLHLDLACVIARKATLALLSSSSPQTILNEARTKANVAGHQYDNETEHGCIAAAQEAWRQNVSGGLPSIVIAE